MVNGDGPEPSDAEDLNAHGPSGDFSGGSDNEIGKRGASPAPGRSDSGNRGHLRSSSVKKQASFKAVSVTKSFLAKAAAGSVPPSKLPGEKGWLIPRFGARRNHGVDDSTIATGTSAGAQPSSSTPGAPPRPRLVAKSGGGREGGLRTSISAASAGHATAPDPSQVWNKNRREYLRECFSRARLPHRD